LKQASPQKKIFGRRVKGWPERSPKPYRLYRDGKFIAAFPTALNMIRNINTRLEA
jgi:hypothetical protein